VLLAKSQVQEDKGYISLVSRDNMTVHSQLTEVVSSILRNTN